MKKILVIFFMMMAVASTCVASDNRWSWVAGCTGENDWYIDIETTQFYVGSDKMKHSKHSCAKVWLLNCDYTEYVMHLSRVEIDLDCVMIRFLSDAVYKLDESQVSSNMTVDAEFRNIIPETVGEEVYKTVVKL